MMFAVLHPRYILNQIARTFVVEWGVIVGIEAPNAPTALQLAKAAGHVAPVIAVFQS